MAQESAGIQLPTVVEVDGWELTSSSLKQPSAEEATARLTDAPADEPDPAATAASEKSSEQIEAQDPGDEDAAATAAVEKPKKSASQRQAELQARINAETRAYHETRRQREAEAAELTRIRQEREALAAAPKPTAEKPVWSKMEEQGKTYDEFVDARDEWVRAQVRADFEKGQAEQRQRAHQERSAGEQARAAAAHEKRINDAVLKHADFLEVIDKNLKDIPDSPFLVEVVQGHEQGAELLYHLAQNPDEARVLTTLQPSKPMRDALRYSDMPVEVLSYFAQHPQEFDRLNRLHPAPALVALGEIHAQLKGAKNGSPVAAVSNAKPPTRPVVGGRTNTSTKHASDMEFSPEWIRAENAREAEKRKVAGRRF